MQDRLTPLTPGPPTETAAPAGRTAMTRPGTPRHHNTLFINTLLDWHRLCNGAEATCAPGAVSGHNAPALSDRGARGSSRSCGVVARGRDGARSLCVLGDHEARTPLSLSDTGDAHDPIDPTEDGVPQRSRGARPHGPLPGRDRLPGRQWPGGVPLWHGGRPGRAGCVRLE